MNECKSCIHKISTIPGHFVEDSLWHLGIKYKVKLSCSSEPIERTTKILLVTAVWQYMPFES